MAEDMAAVTRRLPAGVRGHVLRRNGPPLVRRWRAAVYAALRTRGWRWVDIAEATGRSVGAVAQGAHGADDKLVEVLT